MQGEGNNQNMSPGPQTWAVAAGAGHLKRRISISPFQRYWNFPGAEGGQVCQREATAGARCDTEKGTAVAG